MAKRNFTDSEIKDVFSRLPKNRVGEADRRYVDEVLNTGFNNSDKTRFVSRFEKAFAEKFGVDYAISFCNGTATMHACLMAAGVGPGDEVIVPSMTMASTALVAVECNAVPVFADINPKTFTIDPDDVKRKITPFTKAIIPVALFGLPCDLDPIMELAKEHNLTVIEDNAQAYLASYKGHLCGAQSNAASFSFQGSKHMTTSGEGGMVITNDEGYATRIRKAGALGYNGISCKPGAVTIPRDVRQDHEYRRHTSYGYNYRIPIICAALGLGQLERLDDLVTARQMVSSCYEDAIKGCNWLIPQEEPEGYVNSCWTFVCRIDRESGIDFRAFRKKFIENGGDGLYSCWYPVHLEPVFRNLSFFGDACRAPNFHQMYKGNVKSYNVGDCPVTEALQPTMVQFKNSATTWETAEGQIEALRKTVDFFGRKR